MPLLSKRSEAFKELGIQDYAIFQEKSLTHKILFQAESDGVPADSECNYQNITPEKVTHLISYFPYAIAKLLVSVMGYDDVLEGQLSNPTPTTESYLKYSLAIIRKIYFLTESDAFPVRDFDTSNFFRKLVEYMTVCHALSNVVNHEPIDTPNIVPLGIHNLVGLMEEYDVNGYQSAIAYILLVLPMLTNMYDITYPENKDSEISIVDLKDDNYAHLISRSDRFIIASGGTLTYCLSDDDNPAYEAFFTMNHGNSCQIQFIPNWDEDTDPVEKLVCILILLENQVKTEAASIMRRWDFFTREPRRLSPSGLSKLKRWWKRIVEIDEYYHILYAYRSLISRLSTLEAELKSEDSEITELCEKTKAIWAAMLPDDALPSRIDKILTNVRNETKMFYRAIVMHRGQHGESIRHPSHRNRLVEGLYERYKHSLTKINHEHLNLVDFDQDRPDRTIIENVLMKISKDHGYELSRRRIQRWLKKKHRE